MDRKETTEKTEDIENKYSIHTNAVKTEKQSDTETNYLGALTTTLGTAAGGVEVDPVSLAGSVPLCAGSAFTAGGVEVDPASLAGSVPLCAGAAFTTGGAEVDPVSLAGSVPLCAEAVVAAGGGRSGKSQGRATYGCLPVNTEFMQS
jgi:hypothetical protein